MPAAYLVPAADGYFNGWESIVGGTRAWEVTDDDPSQLGDGTTFFRIRDYLPLPSQVGRVSVRINQVGLSGVLPTSVGVVTTARTVAYSGLLPQNSTLEVGFCTYDGIIQVGASYQPTASYAWNTTAFATNPYTGTAWRRGELAGLELYVQNVFVPVPGNQLHYPRVTQIYLQVGYEDARYGSRRGRIGDDDVRDSSIRGPGAIQ